MAKDQNIFQLEAQIKVCEKLLEKQLPVVGGNSNSKHYALKGKINKLKTRLQHLKWQEYEAK